MKWKPLEEYKEMQQLIDDGMAWKMEGSVGREAMRLIDIGACILGEEDHFDYWGNHVPSRTQVKAGTKGSIEYALAQHRKQIDI